MPWNVVDKLEQICKLLIRKDIKTISLTDLEILLMKYAKVSKKSTVNNYIDILLKFNWIEQIREKNNKDYKFRITYDENKGDLF